MQHKETLFMAILKTAAKYVVPTGKVEARKASTAANEVRKKTPKPI